MCKRRGLDHVRIDGAKVARGPRLLPDQILSQTPSDLGHFNRMGQSVVKNVPFQRPNDLRDTGEPAEGGRVQQPVAVAPGGPSFIGFVWFNV